VKGFFRIMELIYKNPDRHNGQFFKKKFGAKTYDDFAQFAIEGTPAYVTSHGPQRTLKLTGEGVREYHRLVSHESERKRTFALTLASMGVALGTISIAFTTVMQILVNLSNPQLQVSENTFSGFVIMSAVIGVLLGAASFFTLTASAKLLLGSHH
jgi:hypothetical protein